MTLKRTFFVLSLFAIAFGLSFHIFYAAYNSVIDYDMAKVLSYTRLYPDYYSYLTNLKFGQGIATQVYLLSQISHPTVQFLKLISYSFFILTFVSALLISRRISSSDIARSRTVSIATISTSLIFFDATVLQYLGSYGMLVYCQSFLFGVLLVRFASNEVWTNKPFKVKATLYWIPIFIFATYIDTRFSYYVCMVFASSVLLYIRKPNDLVNTIKFGSFVGIFLLLPIFIQFYFVPMLLSYQPNHVKHLLLFEPRNFDTITGFLITNTNLLLETLVGDSRYEKIFLLLVVALGLFTQRKTQFGKGIFLLMILSFGFQIVASVFTLYPFGSIRYSAALLGPILILYFLGIYQLFSLVWLFISGRNSRLATTLVIVIACFYVSIPYMEKQISIRDRANLKEIQLVKRLREFDDRQIWCDSGSEKIVLGYGMNCQLIGTWNYQTGAHESYDFYQKVEAGLSASPDQVAVVLFKVMQKPYFDPILTILDSLRFDKGESLHASLHLYTYNRQTLKKEMEEQSLKKEEPQ